MHAVSQSVSWAAGKGDAKAAKHRLRDAGLLQAQKIEQLQPTPAEKARFATEE